MHPVPRAGIHRGPEETDGFTYPEAERPLQARALATELVSSYSGGDKELLKNWPHDDLTKTALFVEIKSGREALVSRLMTHIRKGKKPSAALQMLARIPFSVFITTNYDNLLEQALTGAGKDPVKLVYNPKPNVETTDYPDDHPDAERPAVFKMHGDLDDVTSIVITDDDYINFIQRMSQPGKFFPIPAEISYRLGKYPTLFIGYSLQDYNLRLRFRTLRWGLDPAKVKMSYSKDPAPDPLTTFSPSRNRNRKNRKSGNRVSQRLKSDTRYLRCRSARGGKRSFTRLLSSRRDVPNSDFDPLNVGQLPRLVVECLLRAIETKPRPPVLPRWGIYPIGLLPGGCLRTNVNVHGAISILAQAVVE